MTNQYLRNTTADYITGAISALKGIKNSVVLINGPVGCATYYGFETGQSTVVPQKIWSLKGEMKIKGTPDDKLLRSQYFGDSSAVPVTNLRYEDFIFGTVDQLKKALNDISAAMDFSLIAVVQAPGTSLLSEVIEPEIMEAAKEKGVPYVYVESPGLSENMLKGYDETIVKIIKAAAKKGPFEKGERPSVNIFGLGSRDLFVDGDLEELRRMLDLCDIDINCAPGAFCREEELEALGRADANVFLSYEHCRKTAEYMKKNWDIPSFDFGCMPIGPDLCESFVRGISKLLDCDCSRALEDIDKTRGRIFYQLARHTGGRGFTKEFKYAAEGESSFLYALSDYLSGYLGIVPETLHPLYRDDENKEPLPFGRTPMEARLQELLLSLGCEEALEGDITKVKDLVLFANANTIAHVLSYSGNIYGVETAYPSSGYINVIPKTLIGPTGALYILEQILNARRLLNAWK